MGNQRGCSVKNSSLTRLFSEAQKVGEGFGDKSTFSLSKVTNFDVFCSPLLISWFSPHHENKIINRTLIDSLVGNGRQAIENNTSRQNVADYAAIVQAWSPHAQFWPPCHKLRGKSPGTLARSCYSAWSVISSHWPFKSRNIIIVIRRTRLNR